MFTSLKRRGYVSKSLGKKGKRVRKHLSKRGKVTATFMTILLIIPLIATFLPKATATPTITFIDPESGHVGKPVRVEGQIDTANGSYVIFFDGEEVKTGSAVGTVVNDTFIVPSHPLGNYSVMLQDATTKENYTFPTSFAVETAYYVNAVVPQLPQQIQEGEATQILVNITGGEANTVYSANITVTDPSDTVYYNDTLQLTNTTNTGYGEGNITYPANFSLGANTDYVGLYTIAFNGTLATANFTVGLTDKTEYRRMRAVNIRGSGYAPSENITVDITTDGFSVMGYPKNVTADTNGVVTDSWATSINATLGTYTVTLTNATGMQVKPIPDIQNFTVIDPIIPISIDPPSGRWGRKITVVGEIITLNGSYQIRWDGKSIKNGTCAPGSAEVNDTFTVPPCTQGSYNITLYDVNQSIESMSSTFNVTESFCYVSADPTRIQEGLNTTLTVTVNEAEPNATLTFTINVTDPQPAFYTATLSVSTNATGSGSNSALYYGGFSVGAHTNYTGTYSVAVGVANEILATGNFTVGLTDRLDYGRTETEMVSVNIRSAGYKPNEVVIINITVAGNPIEDFPLQMLADDYGVIIIDWKIPNNATLGIYTVTLTNASATGTIKPVPDIQNFTVTEVIVYCQTLNKYDREPLAGVSVGAYLDEAYVDSGITNETGWIDLQVSPGNCTFTAFWKILENWVEVGSLNYIVLENGSLISLECELAHLTITIKNKDGFPLPFTAVTVTSNRTGVLEVLEFETNETGTVGTNAVTDVNYTIEAWRYGYSFNTTQIMNLTVNRWINITCPTLTLFVNVLDSKGIPLRNVGVEVYEWSSGVVEPTQSKTTDDLGSTVFQNLMFGKYKIWVYNEDRTIILNQTVVDLTEDQLFFVVHCSIFNVDLSVIVKDYFGQPISNALVEVKRNGVSISPQKVKEGTYSFYNITGGDCQISVSVMGNLETKTLYLDETKVIVFQLENFVVVGGYPLEITQLIACISIGVVIILFALALIYRRLRPRKVPEEKNGKEKSL